MKVIFASHNKNKTREIASLLHGLIQVYSLEDIGFFEEIMETGSTLEKNALIKAQTIYKHTGMNCFADDTGLMVDALNGQPGVHSARYAGEQKSSADNLIKLLEKLKGKENRKAYFKTIICLILKGKVHYFEGILPGKITQEMSGKEGFGYDPIFIPAGFSKTLAEMTLEEKNAISHRAIAFKAMRNFFIENINS
ncbi:MAG: RdgB/HAM1 family non-canonical purine NTP pyrophosphatase [Bacteroidota bacterium]|nr:RdgB/HAM1 family non-canonical purine NTP pyrophosphatase [Bacteroidota bacterium]